MKEDWTECCFEDLLDYEQPTKYIVKSTKYNDIYKMPVLTAGKSFIKGYTNETDGIFENLPTIIFDDFTTATQYVNFKFKVKSSAMKILVPTSKLVNMPLAFYAMQVNQVRSDTHKRYWISVFAKKKFLLPPLVEQTAIVKKIEELFSSLDSGIADLKKTQDQLFIYRQAVLKKAYEGKLTNSVMRKEKLSSISTKIGDGLHGTPNYDEIGSYFFINGNNLNDGKILIKPETKRVNKNEYLKYKKDLDETTVFVSINGTIGNTAYYNNEPVVLGKSACYVNVTNDLDKKYLRYNFLSSEFLNYAIKNATGSTIKNVGLKTIRAYLVPLPKTKEEQYQIIKEIETRLSVCDSVEQNITESLEIAIALRQSILKKAFDGTLLNKEEIALCRKNKEYEPASVLLEKIRAEKKLK